MCVCSGEAESEANVVKLPFSPLLGASHEEKRAKLESITDLATDYFLCKDTTCTYILCRKTKKEEHFWKIGKKYFFKAKIFKCKDTRGKKSFSIVESCRETLLFYNHSIT